MRERTMHESDRLHERERVPLPAEDTASNVREQTLRMREPESQHAGDFDLVSGGPLYELWRRTRLSDRELHLLHRRAIATATLAWLPLLLLSAVEGHAWGSGDAISFLQDLEVHARMLVALPLFMLTEVWAHQELPPICGIVTWLSSTISR